MANGRRLREAHAMPCNEVLGSFGVDLDQGLSHRKVETYTMKQFYRPPLRWWPAGAAAPARRWWPAGACPWSAIRCPWPPRRRRRAGQHRRRVASRYRRATIDYHIVPHGDQLHNLSGDHQHLVLPQDDANLTDTTADEQHKAADNPFEHDHIVPHGDNLDNLNGDHQHPVVPDLDGGDHQHHHCQHERDRPIVYRDSDCYVDFGDDNPFNDEHHNALEQYRDLLASNPFPDNTLRPHVVEATFPTEVAFPSRKPWCSDGDTARDHQHHDHVEQSPRRYVVNFSLGMFYRRSMNDMDTTNDGVSRGDTVVGVEADGWLSCTNGLYLPLVIKGVPTLNLASTGSTGVT